MFTNTFNILLNFRTFIFFDFYDGIYFCFTLFFLISFLQVIVFQILYQNDLSIFFDIFVLGDSTSYIDVIDPSDDALDGGPECNDCALDGAEQVYTIHGFVEEFASYLNKMGITAQPLIKHSLDD